MRSGRNGRPSGETSTAHTRCPLCPVNAPTLLLQLSFHTVIRPLTTHWPSCDTSISETTPPASIGVPTSLPSSTRQRRFLPNHRLRCASHQRGRRLSVFDSDLFYLLLVNDAGGGSVFTRLLDSRQHRTLRSLTQVSTIH